MARVSEDEVREALRRVGDPARDGNVVDLGMITGLVVRDGNVMFSIEIEPERAAEMESLRLACEQVVAGLPGALSVTAVLTAEQPPAPQQPPQQPQQPPQIGRHGSAGGGKMDLPGIGAVIAVASGKGGVGKSTVTVNLAVALSRLGLKVGILDADIYGPSMPRMLGISGQPRSDGDKLETMRGHGVSCMSIGFLVDPDQPTIWRGPMVMGALEQLLGDVNWGELDVMLVDMPPGTGDAQLTMAQKVPLKGAIIVSTPQDIALIDARKGLNMFRQTEVPVMGIIENMSYFHCPSCGERAEIFGHGGARETAAELGCDFLGEIPLHISLRETSDAGTPITASDPGSAEAQAFMKIAERVLAEL
ncbi:MAG: Mrp/NBP35 family ATP-binding protein [Rhodospirillaceae bacterium]|jgi:ATP-binding protein involved in chromosome partitioning|nr:Mrp/NBP35 family ATP-binding protein [Rhodospirillaceae bacterium]MBT5193737.1 Mrp/NBP35 family ATP-binding protein [Rhodospirillaceae bacterium]MBT5896550.1 Mrp/NBP35 family ATP-binding protein [Rhodospirillaceae bacterium]